MTKVSFWSAMESMDTGISCWIEKHGKTVGKAILATATFFAGMAVQNGITTNRVGKSLAHLEEQHIEGALALVNEYNRRYFGDGYEPFILKRQ